MQTDSPQPGPRSRAALVILACAALHGALPAAAQVVINEVMADNRSAVANGAAFPDWIELYNSADLPVSLAGMSLSDDPLLPRQFVFPAGALLPARGYLTVWCSTNTSVDGWRAPFGLGSKTDQVLLYSGEGILLDQLRYGLQAADFSLGRVPNGSGVWCLTDPTPDGANEAQPLAAPSELRINEWLAMPGTGNDDWLELYNGASLPVSLSGLVLTDRSAGAPTNRAVPALSFIGPHGFVQLFASDLNEKDADHLDFKLGSSGEVLTLYQSDRATVIDRVTFGQQVALTSQGRAPDGANHFVSFASALVTPGAANFAMMTSVVISEVLSHTDPPLEDAIELHNLTDQPVNIGGWWLSDAAADPQKYQIPHGTTIGPHDFAVFYASQFGSGAKAFTLDSAEGDEVYLSVVDAAGLLTGQQTSVKFGALKNGVSVGRFLTSTGVEFVPLSQRSFGVDNPVSVPHFRAGTGRSNAAPRLGPVVINEILFRTPSASSLEVEYLELYNPTAAPVPLYDPAHPTNQWRLRNGITFRFSTNISLPAGGFLLLVNFDPVAAPALAHLFRQDFGVPASVPVLGPFDGRLGDTGETLELLWPDNPQGVDSDNPGLVPYELVERIIYAAASPWPVVRKDATHSLQRRAALDYGNDPQNWFAGAATAGRPNLVDDDADGMPDDWERSHALNPSLASDAAADADGDGAVNLDEYRAGTDPQQAGSVLKIQNLHAANATFSFPAVAGRNYGVEYCHSLGASWQAVTNFAAVGTAAVVRFAFAPTNSQGFFRIMGMPAP